MSRFMTVVHVWTVQIEREDGELWLRLLFSVGDRIMFGYTGIVHSD